MAAVEAAEAPVRARPAWVDALITQGVALVTAFLFAAIVGGFIIAAFGESPLVIYSTVWQFGTARTQDFARVLQIATPLIFSALAVAVAFRAGMFNIGVEGQYIVGMMTASAAAVTLDGILPGYTLLLAVILAGVLGSMLWAFVPAILKVKTGAHEVVTTIMMNGIALSLVAWALLNPLKSPEGGLIDLRTDRFVENARVPTIGESLGIEETIPPSVHLSWLFVLALVACLLVWFLLYRTRLGYEIRAVGSSAGSAEAGGVSIGATQLKVFLISGALAGFVGLNHLLVEQGFFGSTYQQFLGFEGIAVAFLGRNSPVGIPLAAILLGMLRRGQDGIAVTTDLPEEILVILEGVLILSVVIAYGIATRILARRRQQVERITEERVAKAEEAA
ncbi:MAG TPA: ABC transporter permease [Actinomycetota bacterium]|nr:ABC transporter permease [Actinomycetota bacterium]